MTSSGNRFIKGGAMLAAVAASLALWACGGDSEVSFEKAGPPPPPDCIARWNADEEALKLGKHFYSQGHDSRAGHVEELDLPGEGLAGQCLAVFAARESDREYGSIGMYTTPGGWVLINQLPVNGEKELLEVQRLGARQANVELRDDGAIAAFE